VLHGVRSCHEAPLISHLLFVNDTMAFCTATEEDAIAVRRVLADYENASGQKVNFDKTEVSFSKGVKMGLEIMEVLGHDKYLGLPTFVGR